MWFPDRLSSCVLFCAGVIGLLSGCRDSSPTVHRLEAVRVLPVEAPHAVEPSGLYLRDGRLFTICDKTDDTVFEILIEDDLARMVPYLQFNPPLGNAPMDFEGITGGPAGSFYLLSETFGRVIQVFPEGRSEWVSSPSLIYSGQQSGYFSEPGAGLEGITRLADGSLLLAIERQPRGLVHFPHPGEMEIQQLNATRFVEELPMMRVSDFTGLFYAEERVWALFRNADLITTLERGADGWQEGEEAWSFRHIVQDPQWAYRDMRFGHGEGLALDEQYFYVILDNNQDARRQDPSDRRPLLLILSRDH